MKTARLIIAASEHCADLFYATRFFAPDDFLYLEKNGRKMALLHDLEIDRARAEMKVDAIFSYTELANGLAPSKRSLPSVAAHFLKKQRVRSVLVPDYFPLGLSRELESQGIRTIVKPGPFFEERESKSAEEIRCLRIAHKITEAGLNRGFEVLRDAKVGGKFLKWNGKTLTSEILRAEIESAILRAGGTPTNAIVAGGIQACDPHERGHGPLKPDSLIILDVFPRDAKTGYFGDMTRTVVRGKASEAQHRLWNTVLKAQKDSLKAMAPGVDGKRLQDQIRTFFTEQGYPTHLENGRNVGFFHGLGHGLGLEIHESPRLGATKFKPGQVITVEPGLYYPQIGGVRHEDVVAITETGSLQLSRFPKPLEL